MCRWTAGEGLGKHGAGMTGPLEVTMRTARTGLGGEPDVQIEPGDSYTEIVKKKARARFQLMRDEGGQQ